MSDPELAIGEGAHASIKPLVQALRKTLTFVEVRAAPPSGDHLEGVLSRQELERCHAQLCEALGPPVKEFGRNATFDHKTQKTVEALGGVRIDQCLFLVPQEARRVVYAALWPWASDPTRVTLKVGVHCVS